MVENNTKVIDLKLVLKRIKANKKLFVILIPIDRYSPTIPEEISVFR